MPWSTPTLRKVREMVRDDITASLYGAAFIGNNVLRVMADAMAGLAHHVLRFIEWLARQLIPDLAETEWLDRHGDIWLTNADGTTGRKMATYSAGAVSVTGAVGLSIPSGSRLVSGDTEFETTEQVILLSDAATPVPVRALDPGVEGNLEPGTAINFVPPPIGLQDTTTVIALGGGTDIESDDDLRVRVLQRIREPPMGGAEHDYVRWALAVPGVTRAWCAGNEMGIGTVTVRIMCDILRASNEGFPLEEDLERATEYIDSVRPVAVKDFWVLSPIKYPIDITILDLVPDTTDLRGAIEQSLLDMLYVQASPGQTIYGVWKSAAVYNVPGVISFKLTTTADDVMPSAGHMAVLGDIYYEQTDSV